MRFLPFILLMGCVTVAEPLAWSQGHSREAERHIADAISRAVPGTPTAERLDDALFHVRRGMAWQSAAIKHVGPPEMLPDIPRGLSDVRGTISEDDALRQWEAQAEASREAKNGLMALIGVAGTGGAGLGGIAFLLRKRVMSMLLDKDADLDRERRERQRQEAIARQYDEAIEKLPQEERRKIQLPPEAKVAHAQIESERRRDENV